MARETKQLSIGRRRVAVSNLDKLLYPGTKFKARCGNRVHWMDQGQPPAPLAVRRAPGR